MSNSTSPRPATGVRPRFIGRVLLGCCGANYEHIHEGAERNWYYSLGFSVIITSVTAGLSAALLIFTNFSSAPTELVAGIGVFWAIVVFNLDRLIVSRILGRPSVPNKLALFGARLVLAVGVALLMAEGVELVLFESEIDQQVIETNTTTYQDELATWQQKINAARTEARTNFADQLAKPGDTVDDLNEQIGALDKALATDNQTLACETRPRDFAPGVCPSGTGYEGFGREAAIASARVLETGTNLDAARKRLRDYTVVSVAIDGAFSPEDLEKCGKSRSLTSLTPQESDACTAELLVQDQVASTVEAKPVPEDSVDGPIRRIAALSALGSGEHGGTIWAVRIILLLIVASIDLVPLTAKLFGGATGHDIRARADNIRASSEYARELASEVHTDAQELHSKSRGGFHLFGVGWGHRHRAAKERDDFHFQRLQNQAALEMAQWEDPKSVVPRRVGTRKQPPRNPASSEQTPSDQDRDSLDQTAPDEPLLVEVGSVKSGDILRTSGSGDYRDKEYVLEGRIPVISQPFYQLWMAHRADESRARKYIVKMCFALDDESSNAGLALLKRDLFAAALHNEHVIDIVSGPRVQADERSGARYVVMPYIKDGDLLTYDAKYRKAYQQPIPLLELLEIIRQVLEGLLASHTGGVLHLDIKPENILIDASDEERGVRAVITDFGIAALISELENSYVTSTFIGSEPYAPLEQVLPRTRFGHRNSLTDLWAVGAVAFKMITAANPRSFAEAEALEVLPKTPSGHLDRDHQKFFDWLELTAPVAPRLDSIYPDFPRPIADLIEQWLQNDKDKRVTQGTDTTGRAAPGVMKDALACLDRAIKAIR